MPRMSSSEPAGFVAELGATALLGGHNMTVVGAMPLRTLVKMRRSMRAVRLGLARSRTPWSWSNVAATVLTLFAPVSRRLSSFEPASQRGTVGLGLAANALRCPRKVGISNVVWYER